MLVKGCDCSIVIKTSHVDIDIPYSEETIREVITLLQEEAAIEGDGVCRAIRKKCGVTGCIVTPLTIGTTPVLLYLAMGSAGLPVFVSETRSMYKYCLELLSMDDSEGFDLIQARIGNREWGVGNRVRMLFENCRVKSFELRFERERAVKLKLDIHGECPAAVYPYNDMARCQTSGTGERFHSDFIKVTIDGKEYTNIYGITFVSNKENGTKTEIWIRRSLETDFEIPEIIDELVITSRLVRDKYEDRHFGMFRITVYGLVMTSDETNVNAPDAVIDPLRYYANGNVKTEVYNNEKLEIRN